ncbi:erg10, acetyl-CoA C-acetyltransferase [Kalmusia sp. IMI 367209]|nr:erg10, acetyl-CoA C-acetyltransferase [Kalmusia sp. IMI 367209]
MADPRANAVDETYPDGDIARYEIAGSSGAGPSAAVEDGDVDKVESEEVDKIRTQDNVLLAGYVLFGCSFVFAFADGTSKLGQNAALGPGLPITTVCTTVNIMCASSMNAIAVGAQGLKLQGHRERHLRASAPGSDQLERGEPVGAMLPATLMQKYG